MAFGLGGTGGPFAELRRRRVLRTLAAYVVAGWVVLQVADVTFEPLGLPHWVQRGLIIAVIAGILPTAVLAWVYDLTRRGLVRTPPADDAARDQIGRAMALRRRDDDAGPGGVSSPAQSLDTHTGGVPGGDAVGGGRAPAIASIAILPFADLSQAHDQDWFCDGLAEEIIDSLCCVRGLRVASRTASFRFRDGATDPREIGRQLTVDVILEGSVRKAGDQLKVSAQLIDAQTGFHLWSESYSRRLEDVFAIQGEIASNVAAALRLSIAGPGEGRSARYAPRNIDAYEFYLRGRQLSSQDGQGGDYAWRHAPVLFRRAIELDPGYAQALAGLADSLSQQIQWRFLAAEPALTEAEAAAHRALELAPDLAEAHVALGNIRSLKGDDTGARSAFQRAIALNPGLYEAHYYLGRHCYAQGDYAFAAACFEEAFRLRPDQFVVLGLAVGAVDAGGDHARALRLSAHIRDGLRRQVELEPENARAHFFLGGALIRLGDRAGGLAESEFALQLRPDEFATLYNVACNYVAAGGYEHALDLLERAIRLGFGYVDWFQNDLDLAPLRGHQRFAMLLAQLREREVAASPAQVRAQSPAGT